MSSETDPNVYRFSGYQPPLIKLDMSGHAYWVEPIHPYYDSQPTYWAPPPANRSISKNTKLIKPVFFLKEDKTENPKIINKLNKLI